MDWCFGLLQMSVNNLSIIWCSKELVLSSQYRVSSVVVEAHDVPMKLILFLTSLTPTVTCLPVSRDVMGAEPGQQVITRKTLHIIVAGSGSWNDLSVCLLVYFVPTRNVNSLQQDSCWAWSPPSSPSPCWCWDWPPPTPSRSTNMSSYSTRWEADWRT